MKGNTVTVITLPKMYALKLKLFLHHGIRNENLFPGDCIVPEIPLYMLVSQV